MEKFSPFENAYIVNLKDNSDMSWKEIVQNYNEKFNQLVTSDSIRKRYNRCKEIMTDEEYNKIMASDEQAVDILKKNQRITKTNRLVNTNNRVVLECWNDRDDIIDAIQSVIDGGEFPKYDVPKLLKSSNKEKMTFEQLISDVHFGKLIKDDNGNIIVNGEEITRRVQKLTNQILKEIERNKGFFDIERFVIGMLGDLIESSHMHGEESLKGCEYGTSRQIFECIQSLFNHLLVPIAMTGIPIIDIYCVPGNHDRVEEKQTYVQPGENNLTYVIYKTLEMMCKAANLKNIEFHITTGGYICADIYGNNIVYEHGHELKSLDRQKMLNMLNNRQNQIGKIVHFYRIGHWHEKVEYGQGRIQVNGSVPGQDDYAKGKGFDSEALQILNCYVKTNKRRTSFFKSFPIYLEEIR
jgi:hypothetical protein